MLCEHFGRCGGCAYSDISYEEELAIKQAGLAETLGGRSIKLHPAPALQGYRNKMEFSFGDSGANSPLALGIRKKRSFYEVASPENCVLICDDFKKIVAFAAEFFHNAGETFFHRKRHTGALRHLVLRRGEFTGEILVMLSASSALQASLDDFVSGLLALPLEGSIVGILHAENDGVADAVKNENVKLLHGRDYFFEKICGLTFKVSVFSFFQTNSRGAEVLYDVVKRFAGAGRVALDLYCGTGTIAQIIAPAFERVIGAEIVEEAIIAARENAAANGIANCDFFAEDTLDFLQKVKISGEGAESDNCESLSEIFEKDGKQNADCIILDPPRDGLHPKALGQIAALGAPRVIYVACKPKSLARDLPAFIEAGYVVKEIEAVDMFPRTPHVEAVALLERGQPC